MDEVMLSLSDYFKSKIFSEEDLNKALELSQIYGSVFWAADMGINDASDIETELVERIGKSLECVVKSAIQRRTRFMSYQGTCYLIGGHTRFKKRLASEYDSKPESYYNQRHISRNDEQD
ncbi:hypothetical protein [Pseudomonas sp. P8_241]|uniref:hypothetical protein n=1 Tax=Pseudomonas sp. P8_241 TaxID=3043445 RepID=UPI002A3692C7|nr:hypothetical protein [Pseudomonas sp. P8_241]WPN48575.1 hypothetical protein QMK58_07890 [Pseudomonas sp. P8_241]